MQNQKKIIVPYSSFFLSVLVAFGLVNPEFSFLFVTATVSPFDLLASLILFVAKPPQFKSYLALFVIFIIILNLISSLTNSSSPELNAFSSSFRIIYYVWIALALTNHKNPMKVLILSVLISAAINVALSWFFWFQNPRLIGTFPMLHLVHEGAAIELNRNFNVFFLALGVNICCIFLKIYKPTASQSLAVYALLVALTISSVLSFSKGGWLATAIPLLMLTPLRYQVAALPVIFIFIVQSPISGIVSLFLDRLTMSGSTNNERVDFIYDALAIINANPIFGVGTGAYLEETLKLGLSKTIDPHNTFLWIWAEQGAGVVFMYALFVSLGFHAVYKYFQSMPIAISIVGQYIIFASTSGLPFSMKFYWFLFIVLIVFKESRVANEIGLKWRHQ